MKLLTVFPFQWLSPAPRISTPLGWVEHSRPRHAGIARSLRGWNTPLVWLHLVSSFSFIYKLKQRNLFLIKIKIGGAGGACAIFRAVTWDGGLCSAERCSWATIVGLAWVKLGGEFSSAVSRLGLKWGTFIVPSLGDWCDSGKEF